MSYAVGVVKDVLITSPEAIEKIEVDLTDIFRTCLRPPPKLDLVEWADEYRYLPDNSAESGRWKTKRVEAARQPMLSISDPQVQEVTVMACIQFMKTELMLNTAMYYMHQEPSPIMYIAPNEKLAEAWSKERLVKSVNATPVTANIFSDNRRGEGNTILQKQYPGGQISIVSARNPGDLAMRACMIMLFDEVDKYPYNVGAGSGGSGGEGDSIAVGWGRSTTYGKRAKKVVACSPTVEGRSRVAKEYKNSNQSVFLQPCPHCDHAKTLTWPDVHIPKNDKGEFLHQQAAIRCSECGALWTEADRLKSIRNGYWEATKPEITWHHGYKVSSLASPFIEPTTLAKEFSDAQGSPESLKAFYNTRMAETWKEVSDQPDHERLYERREAYKIGIVPRGGLFLTCGIDVQKGYLVYEVVAWGRRKENWSIEKGVIPGHISEDETHERLREFLDRTFTNCIGVEMPVLKTCIDSGYETQQVYNFVRNYGSARVVAVKGEKDENLSTILGTPKPVDINLDGKRISNGTMLWHVGGSVIKEEFYRWLNLKKPTDEALATGNGFPSGYCHYPMYDEEFFLQITAEQHVMLTDNRGFQTYQWQKVRDDNHFLDCRVYARSGASMLQIDRMKDADWNSLEAKYYPDLSPDEVEEKPPEPKPVSKKPTRKKKRKGWIKR
nr:terminase gpA endonuclease subunit [Pseudoalteromonas sp. Of7M-16]